MRAVLVALALATSTAFMAPTSPLRSAPVLRAGIFDLSAQEGGKDVKLSKFDNKKAILVVNLASE